MSSSKPEISTSDDDRSIGEPLFSDYLVNELPDSNNSHEPVIDAALSARIEVLEAEVTHLSSMPAENDSSGLSKYLIMILSLDFIPVSFPLKFYCCFLNSLGQLLTN